MDSNNNRSRPQRMISLWDGYYNYYYFIYETMGKSEHNRYYIVRGYWNRSSRAFKHLNYLNEETPKDKLIINFISNQPYFVIYLFKMKS